MSKRQSRRPVVNSDAPKRKPRRVSKIDKTTLISEPGIDAFLKRVFPGSQTSTSLNNPFREETRIYSAVSLIADSAAMVPLRIYTSDPKVNRQTAEQVPFDDPVARLFEHVNPLMDPSDLRERMTLGMELTGGTYWILLRSNGMQVASSDSQDMSAEIDLPDEIWPVTQNTAKPVIDPRTNMPIGWRVNMGSGTPRTFDAPSLLHFRYPDPGGGIEGLAPLEVAIARAEQIKRAAGYQDAILENGGDPGGVMIVKNGKTETIERLQEAVDEQWNDGGRAGDTRVVGGDVTWTPNPIGPKDMQYKELTEVNWQAISEVFRVPPTLLGMRSANFAEHKLHLREFWTIKMLALFRRYEQTLNSRFFPRLRDPRFRGYRASFDVSSVDALQGELGDQAEAAAKLVNLGVPLNLALRVAGIEIDPIDGGDVALVSNNLRALTDLIAGDAEDSSPSTPASPPEDDSGLDDGDVSEQDRSVVSPPGGDVGGLTTVGVAALFRTERQRRQYEKTVETRRERSDRRIAARVRAWARLLRAAQLAHLDKIAGGRQKVDVSTLRAPRMMSDRAATSLIMSYGNTNGALLSWERRHRRLLSESPIETLYDNALIQKAELSPQELDALILSISNSTFWEREFAEEVAESLNAAFLEMAENVGFELGIDATSLSNPVARQFIQNKLFRLKEGVNSTVANDLRRKYAELFAQSPTGGTGTLAEKLRPLLPGAKAGTREVFGATHKRARMIARTETAQIDGYVRFESFRNGGVERHEWITVGDKAVRASHRALDGQVRRLDETFDVSPHGVLRYANDYEGHPAEIINCRCVMAPVIDE